MKIEILAPRGKGVKYSQTMLLQFVHLLTLAFLLQFGKTKRQTTLSLTTSP